MSKFTNNVAVSILLSWALWTAPGFAGAGIGDIPSDYLGIDRHDDDVYVSQHKGKVLIATFWATWCGYCMTEMAVLENLQRQVGKQRIELVGVNFNENLDTWHKIQRKLYSVTMTLTRDARGDIKKAYGVNAVPHMFIIGKDGRVAYIHQGYAQSELPEIVAEITALINQPLPRQDDATPAAQQQ